MLQLFDTLKPHLEKILGPHHGGYTVPQRAQGEFGILIGDKAYWNIKSVAFFFRKAQSNCLTNTA